MRAGGFSSSQAEALATLISDFTEVSSKPAQRDDVSRLNRTITLLVVYLAVELGSKPDSVLRGAFDLVKGLSKGGGS